MCNMYTWISELGLGFHFIPCFKYTFESQVVARERLTNGKASAPVSLRVSVGDENDNAPILRPHPAITIQVQ